MRSIRRILAAVKDPAARSQPAATKAARLAAAFGAELELFHAIDTPIYDDPARDARRTADSVEHTWRDHRLAQLDAISRHLREPGVETVIAVDYDYPIAEAIVRRANRIDADLIVAQRHAGKHFAPWLLTFTDWELLRLCPVPLMLVKSPRAWRRPAVLAAVDPAHAFAKPAKLDGEILRAGALVSEALGGTLHAVHAFASMPASGLPGGLADPKLMAQMAADSAREARRGFEHALRSTDMPRTRRHLVAGHPISVIQDVAREVHSAIVVMGAVSRSGLKRLFIGNTAERVLDRLTCDVLVVKPPHFEPARVGATRRGPRTVTAPLPPL
jgi:universal stress protein E